MKKHIHITLVFLLALTGLSKPLFSQCTGVYINEVMASPVPPTGQPLFNSNSLIDHIYGTFPTNAEYIELFNPSPCQPFDISCYILYCNLNDPTNPNPAQQKDSGAFVFPPGTIIPPLGFVSVGGPASGATFPLDVYENRFCGNTRWYLDNTRGYMALANATGTIVDAVYWATNASDLNTLDCFKHSLTVTCACSGTLTLPAAINIPGIAYGGDNKTANSVGGNTSNSLGYSVQRQLDALTPWVIDKVGSINNCNGGPQNCYSLAVNTNSTNISCSQTTGSVSVSSSFTGPTRGAYSYSWNTGATGTSASGLAAGTYTVTVTDVCGCTKTQTTAIASGGGLTLNTSTTNITCTNPGAGSATANPSGGSGSYTYTWNNGQNAQTATGLTAGTYTVTVADAANCTGTASVTITQQATFTSTISSTNASCGSTNGTATANVTGGGNSPFTYSWTGTTQTTANITGVSAGSYTVVITDNSGCSATHSVSITQPVSFTLSSSSTPAQCGVNNGTATATVTGGITPFTYAWASGGQTTPTATGLAQGIYTVTVTDGNNCSSTQTASVGGSNPTPLTLSTSPVTELCSGLGTTLTATASGGASPIVYSWSTGASTTSISVTPASSSTYTVTVTDACNQIQTQTTQVNINPIPVPLFISSGPPSCKEVCVKFTDQSTIASPGSIKKYQWGFGDNSTSTLTDPSHCYTTTGTYTVILSVTSDKGCTATTTNTVTVNVDPSPIADFSYSPDVISMLEKPVVTFTDHSTNANTWEWNFGDMLDTTNTNTSTLQNPIHTYVKEGTYCITLLVTNNLGCKDSIPKCLEILPDWSFYIPNTFTPNGNGINDVFYGVAINVTDYEMWIFDRWGNQIFHGDGPNDTWNGKVEGGGSNEIAQIDTYVWVVQFKDVFQKTHRRVGHVNLLK